jgi:TolB-like protein
MGTDQPKLAATDKPSIAVLPFDNMSGDDEQEYFSDGITEDIITALSRFRQLLVLARNTSFTFKGRSVDVKAVARELNVRYVLEGSVRKAGNRVRITVQLIDGTSGNHLWAEKYDRDLEDIFGVQDEITQMVAGAIEPEITKAEFERVRRTPPSSLDAWSLYQHGMHHFHLWTKENNEEARRLFEAAVELDPKFSAPHASIARTFSRGIVSELPENLEEHKKLALKAARTAVTLDRDDAYAHVGLGFAQHQADPEASIRAFEVALSINPILAIALFGIGVALSSGRQPERAITHLQTAIRLSPRDPILAAFYRVMGTAYFAMGDYQATIDWSAKAGSDVDELGRMGVVQLAAFAHLGHESEMNRARDALMKSIPHLTVSHALKISPELGEPYADGLRKAGLPE